MKNKSVFLTGGTGFIGKELIKGLLKNSHTLYLLIRGRKEVNANQRFVKLIHEILNGLPKKQANQLILVEGDIEKDRLGLSENAFLELAEKIEIIYHAAASVQLTDPLEDVRRINVKGTENILELAKLAAQSHFERLNYISTAYVAGTRSGIIYEHELDCKQSFGNTYEQAKFEAELAVEQAKQELPICIYRPSMVMGHSQTGWTSAFNVLYGPIKMIYNQSLKLGPGGPKSLVDPVPIDYVINAILYLSQMGSVVNGKTFHLTVGKEREISVKELVDLSCLYLNQAFDKYGIDRRTIKPKLIAPKAFKTVGEFFALTLKKRKREKLNNLLTYVNYTMHPKHFDNRQAAQFLEPVGITAPRLQEYLQVICDYAVQYDFGRKVDFSKENTNKKSEKRQKYRAITTEIAT